jgi:hypothetical protein
MNKFFIFVSALFIGYFTMGFYLSQYEFKLMGKKLNIENLQSSYKVHQNVYSDLTIGSGQANTIALAAQVNSSQFILMTDLNPSISVDNDYYLSNVGLLFGVKLQTDDHSVTYYSADVKSFEKNSIITKPGKNSLLIANMESVNKDITHYDGIDTINLKKIAYRVWDKKKLSTIWSLIFYPFNPKISLIRLFRDPEEELDYFDRLSQRQKTNMYLSSEATAKAIPFANWLIKFPSYSTIFSIASQRVLVNSEMTHDMKKDSKNILNALKSGSHYISIDTLGDSKGFESYVYSNYKKKYSFMGDELKFDSSLRLFYKLPNEPSSFYEIVLYRNGQRVDHRSVARGDFPIAEKGVYRLQVRLNTDLPFPDNNKWLTWIFTNNFYIK